MSLPRLRLSELHGLSPAERDEKIEEFIKAGKQITNEQALEELTQKLDRLEEIYEITSNEMKSQLRQGFLQETQEICYWLMLLKLREKLLELW